VRRTRARDAEALDLGEEPLALDLGESVDLDTTETALDLGDDALALEEEEAVDTSATFEEIHQDTVAKVTTAFAQRAQDDRARFLDATDSEYWFAVCFTSREQKEAFLNAVQWPGVEPDDKYIHGEDIASALVIELPPARFVPPGEKVNKDLVRLGVIGEE
jgi:hypothetical protein